MLCNTFTPIRDLMITNRALVMAGRAFQVPTQPLPFSYISGTISNTAYITPAPTGIINFNTAGAGTLMLSGATTVNTTPQVADEWENFSAFGSQVPSPQIPAGAFLIIGHCVWSWLLALAAGCFAAFVNRPLVLASQ